MTSIPFGEFGNIHQYREIDANSYDTVFYYEIPVGYVGFFWYFYNIWYPDTYLLIKIDGEIAETIRRQTGEVNNPFKFKKPYLITRDLEIIAHNDSDKNHNFEVLCDGEIYDEVEARRQINAEINSTS